MSFDRDRPLGYVVVEWNQASHQPGLGNFADLTDDLEWAREDAAARRKDAVSRGRGERYTVAAVVELDDEEEP